jgi:phosphoribosylformylglycinamidine synthase
MIRNKKGVFDPEGKVIEGGLHRLGYEEVDAVRVGKVIDIEVDSDDPDVVMERIHAMCKAFLVNPVIEDYHIELGDEA